jgi:hypothetical protein
MRSLTPRPERHSTAGERLAPRALSEPLSQRQLVQWSLLTCPDPKKGSVP